MAAQHEISEELGPYAADCSLCAMRGECGPDGRCGDCPIDLERLFEEIRADHDIDLEPPAHWMPVVQAALEHQFNREKRGWPFPRGLHPLILLAHEIHADEAGRLERWVLKQASEKAKRKRK